MENSVPPGFLCFRVLRVYFILTWFFVVTVLHFAFLSLLTTQNTNTHAHGRIFFSFLVVSLYLIRTSFFVFTVLAFFLPFVLYCTKHATQTPMSLAGFEPATPESDRPQTLALGRSATRIGIRTPVRPVRSESLYRLSYRGLFMLQASALRAGR